MTDCAERGKGGREGVGERRQARARERRRAVLLAGVGWRRGLQLLLLLRLVVVVGSVSFWRARLR